MFSRWDLFGLGCAGVSVTVVVVVRLLYLIALGRGLEACAPSRREMAPGMVWLHLVPLGHLFFRFWTASAVGRSLRQEFEARGLRTVGSFGTAPGVMVGVVAVVTRLVLLLGFGAALWADEERLAGLTVAAGVLLGVVELVLVIVHWVVVAGATGRLGETRPAGADEPPGADADTRGYRDFDEDYRPVPRRRPRTSQM